MGCDVCGSENSRFLMLAKRVRGFGENKYFFCEDCGCVYQKEPPSDTALDEYYEKKRSGLRDINEQLLRLARSKEDANLKRAEFILSNIDKTCPKTMADIGCGDGGLVRLFAHRGWDAAGIEPSSATTEFAKRHHGIRVLNCQYKEGVFKEGSMGVLTMCQVLEHLKNPDAILQSIRKDLHPAGVFYLDVPTYLLHGKKELALEELASTHLRLFTLENLSLYLEKNGFDVIGSIPRMQFKPGCPWFGILARRGEFKNHFFASNISFSDLKKALFRARVNSFFASLLEMVKNALKFALRIILPKGPYNRLKNMFKKKRKKE